MWWYQRYCNPSFLGYALSLSAKIGAPSKSRLAKKKCSDAKKVIQSLHWCTMCLTQADSSKKVLIVSVYEPDSLTETMRIFLGSNMQQQQQQQPRCLFRKPKWMCTFNGNDVSYRLNYLLLSMHGSSSSLSIHAKSNWLAAPPFDSIQLTAPRDFALRMCVLVINWSYKTRWHCNTMFI